MVDARDKTDYSDLIFSSNPKEKTFDKTSFLGCYTMFSSLRTAGAAAAAAAAALVGSPTVHAEGYAIQEHWRVSLVIPFMDSVPYV